MIHLILAFSRPNFSALLLALFSSLLDFRGLSYGRFVFWRNYNFGAEVRRTSDVRLRFVGFNFSHVQLLGFVVVMIRSYSFHHLDQGK